MSTLNAPLLVDTYVDPLQPDNGLGSTRRLCVGIDGDIMGSFPYADGMGTGGLCRIWVKFDISTIPAGSTINSAVLDFPVFFSADSYTNFPCVIFRCTDNTSVTESMTYNNAPNISLLPTAVDIEMAVAPAVQNSADISAFVTAALADGVVSVMVQTEGEYIGYDIDSYSNAYNKDSGYVTEITTLTIDYSVPSGRRSSVVLLT